MQIKFSKQCRLKSKVNNISFCEAAQLIIKIAAS